MLGVDLGAVRVGLAVSDLLGFTAQPLETLRCVGPRKDLQAIERIAREWAVSRVVVGLPRLMSGEEGERAVASREFAAALEKRLAGVTVELWDERLSSVEAERAMVAADVGRRRRRESIDALAAVLILQNWLDAHAGAAR